MLTATRGPYVLVIQPDDDPFNPREDDNFRENGLLPPALSPGRPSQLHR